MEDPRKARQARPFTRTGRPHGPPASGRGRTARRGLTGHGLARARGQEAGRRTPPSRPGRSTSGASPSASPSRTTRARTTPSTAPPTTGSGAPTAPTSGPARSSVSRRPTPAPWNRYRVPLSPTRTSTRSPSAPTRVRTRAAEFRYAGRGGVHGPRGGRAAPGGHCGGPSRSGPARRIGAGQAPSAIRPAGAPKTRCPQAGGLRRSLACLTTIQAVRTRSRRSSRTAV